MNHDRNRISTLVPATVMVALVLSLGQALLAQPNEANGSAIQGTWRVSVTQRDCQNGHPLGTSFPSLLTFNQGGTLQESTANPHFYPMLRLPGQGYWNVVGSGNGTYDASSIAFITLNGGLAMTQRIDQKISLSGDQFSSDATIMFYDPEGKLIKSGCATAVAVRYK